MRNSIIPLLGILLLAGCSAGNSKSDAYGNFEAIETIISSEVQGTLLYFPVEQGSLLGEGVLAAKLDTVAVLLKREQAFAQMNGSRARLASIDAQVKVQEEQKKNLLIEKERFENLLKENAVPAKQLDDLLGNLRVLESQIVSVNIQKAAIRAEMEGIQAQVNQINDQLRRCSVLNPLQGTVLEKYVETHEMITPGKALYKIAALDTLILRAYISGNDLSRVKLGQHMKVLIDDQSEKPLSGTLQWLSPVAEFTPKIIQTREERVKLVYAMKLKVANDGRLKIGMPGEVMFNQE